MGRDDWYRNEEWSSQTEAAFFTKLKRARDKAQYLKIQASYLAKSHPDTSIQLLKQFFAFPDKIFIADAHATMAAAHLSLGNIEDAIESYETVLKREAEFPNAKTNTYLDLPFLIAEESLTSKFDRALEILELHESEIVFPLAKYMWHAAKAAILQLSDENLARENARNAIEAMGQRMSGFKYHQKVGLVEIEITKTNVHRTVVALAVN